MKPVKTDQVDHGWKWYNAFFIEEFAKAKAGVMLYQCVIQIEKADKFRHHSFR